MVQVVAVLIALLINIKVFECVSIGSTMPVKYHTLRHGRHVLQHSRPSRARSNRRKTALNDDNINNHNDELNDENKMHQMHEIVNISTDHGNLNSFYSSIDDISRQFSKFSWHISPNDLIMSFDAFVTHKEHLNSARDYLEREIKFIACPADYDLHRYEIDSHYLQTTSYYSTCNRLPNPSIEMKTDNPVQYNSKGELGYRLRVGFNGTIDLRSPFLRAHLQYDTPLRWTIIALLPSANVDNVSKDSQSPGVVSNPSVKQFMLFSPSVRFYRDLQSDHILLQSIHMDLWEYIRLSERPVPQTPQEAIDILRPLSYDIEGTWRRYADLDDLFKNCSGYVGSCDRWRITTARQRIQEAMNLLEQYFRLRYNY